MTRSNNLSHALMRAEPGVISPSPSSRGRYQGVLQILGFNRRFYLSTVVVVSLVLIIALRLPQQWGFCLLLAILPAMFWTCSSLAVSHYVYDRFPLYDLRWVARAFPNPPRRWVNIHAGLDETTQLLSALFPSATGKALDIYDSREMTEPSIAQAREQARRLSTIRSTSARWNSLPIADDTLAAAFLIFVAHELRRHEARVELLKELSRSLQHGGTIVLVEHTRDWANFLAFGPGFLHFFSKRTWRQAISAAGLQIGEEFPMTPFVRVFLLRRAA